MKKKSIICLLLVFLVACLMLTACGGNGGGNGGTDEPEEVTLESWMADHPEEMEQVEVEEGMEVSFDKNNLIYTYDLSVLDVDEESAKSETMIEALTEGLEGATDTFNGIIDDLESETEITGITVTVIYTYKGTVLVEKTYSK